MAAAPLWKVYRAGGEYIASVRAPLYGAMILGGIGEDGATLRYGHSKVVWREGVDGHAADSYDVVENVAIAATR